MLDTDILAEAAAEVSHDDLHQTLQDCATAAAARTLPLFRTRLNIANKQAEGFDPVTEADRQAEAAIRAVIEKRFPGHAIIGEEYDSKQTGSDFCWIIDPVDGTRAFMSGLPVWGTLIGVTYRGRAIAGLMSQPFTGETFIAAGGRGEWRHASEIRPLKARATTSLAEATLFTTTPALFTAPGYRQAFDALEARLRLSRYGCDCYAYALLALGQIDLVVEPAMNSYDIAALIPLIESAGGVVGTWTGGRAEQGGDIIAAATPGLRDAALEIMRQYLPE